MSAIVRAERLFLRHPGSERDAVRDLTLAVAPGERLVLLGPNGSGKSTLLAGLAGAIPPRRGRVFLDGRDLREFSRRRIAGRLAWLPQAPSAPEALRVAALVESGRAAHRPLLGAPSRQGAAAVRRALSALDLGDLSAREVGRLSGGERRRAWLAMVLAQEAPLLLLDEPTAALDLRHQWEVLDHLERASSELGRTLVVTLHDVAQAVRFATRIALLHRGRLYGAGPPGEVLDASAFRDVFGVDAWMEKVDGRSLVVVRGPAEPLRNL